MSRLRNPFAVLKDLDPSEPEFVFAPSILAGNGGGAFSSPSSSSSSSSSAAVAAAASSGPLPGAGRPSGSGAPSWKATASIDLQGVADELQRSLAGPGGSDGSGGGVLPSGAGKNATPFDFSAFTSVTAQTELQIAQAAQAAQAAAAAARQRAVDEHLAKVHERDKAEELFRFGGRGGGDMSRGARQRKAEAAERKEAHAERLGAKVMKRDASKKRMNQIKNLYK